VLLTELRERDYTASVQSLRRHLHPLRDSITSPRPSAAIRPRPAVPKPRRTTRSIMTDPDHLTPEDRAELATVIGACPEPAATARHVRDFADLMNKHCGDRLDTWIQQIEADDLPHLHSLTIGLRRDLAAIPAGLTEQQVRTCRRTRQSRDVETTDVRPSQPRPAPQTGPPHLNPSRLHKRPTTPRFSNEVPAGSGHRWPRR
jgi:hypothetical protein